MLEVSRSRRPRRNQMACWRLGCRHQALDDGLADGLDLRAPESGQRRILVGPASRLAARWWQYVRSSLLRTHVCSKLAKMPCMHVLSWPLFSVAQSLIQDPQNPQLT